MAKEPIQPLIQRLSTSRTGLIFKRPTTSFLSLSRNTCKVSSRSRISTSLTPSSLLPQAIIRATTARPSRQHAQRQRRLLLQSQLLLLRMITTNITVSITGSRLSQQHRRPQPTAPLPLPLPLPLPTTSSTLSSPRRQLRRRLRRRHRPRRITKRLTTRTTNIMRSSSKSRRLRLQQQPNPLLPQATTTASITHSKPRRSQLLLSHPTTSSTASRRLQQR